MLRQTKIVATLGPSSSDPITLRAMLTAGVDVVRINFSHADASASQLISLVREIAEELQLPVAVMADLQGPKIRIGRFENKSITLVEGQDFTLDCNAAELLGNHTEVSVAYPNLSAELTPGDHLLLNDGLVELEVKEIVGSKIHCRVIEGGILSDLKGLNRKGGGLAARTMTEKDKRDLRTAIEAEVDYISLSFVKDAEDIRHTRALMSEFGKKIPIIAKIERTEALDYLTEIILESDAIMVARGDLGVEIGAAEVPAIQKHIIGEARRLDKVVITATQMMESMINNPQPTRAEVSDVANAILDGTDAVMLSAETASGQFPVKVLTMVNKICLSAEKHASFYYDSNDETCHYQRADQAIAMATMHAANHFPIRAIITLTESGDTALWISRQQSRVPIIAVSANKRTIGRLCLAHNVFPVFMNYYSFNSETLNQQVLTELIRLGHLETKGFVLLTRGRIIGTAGGTNSMEIIQV
ncbi:pyruvate kinase [Fluoribacter dumoffii]|uniref:Pyruvate kinase n=1 Tax=Fluoribacter dumoffii TaxID=463 RepID=A0A377GEW0_9GAMM|nr:pyruvate kinase [Fluoribacter dumoffii]KTC91339.1 pyruvate kinase II [Fluoribacter dumoffii NY 23]MCW8387533.1 pyruvate kinase [Fluoribacter dumoffii]MCW8416959.1 pyruvate kinase [Fluoribacter dumoffii]MCW8455201.1 pyruvate kinase [Fluoribacter dumoffii]MCW8460722.1 pyruvate kinase [Fluoribacter dumoffii]